MTSIQLNDQQREAITLTQTWQENNRSDLFDHVLRQPENGHFTAEAAAVNLELYRADSYPEPRYVTQTLIERDANFAAHVLDVAKQDREGTLPEHGFAQQTRYRQMLKSMPAEALGSLLEQEHQLYDAALQAKASPAEIRRYEARLGALQEALGFGKSAARG
jgi:hypothetical protein